MSESDRTSQRTLFEHERVVTAIFRLIVTAILILVLTQVGSAASSLSTDFAGVLSTIG